MCYCIRARWFADVSSMWAPPAISWFISPSNYSYLRTINHSYWSYVHQLSYRKRGPHFVGMIHEPTSHNVPPVVVSPPQLGKSKPGLQLGWE